MGLNPIQSKKVADCLAAIRTIASNNTVELRWIAAHSGLWGNERADESAKHGTALDIILNCPDPQSCIKHLINTKVQRLNMRQHPMDQEKTRPRQLNHMIQ